MRIVAIIIAIASITLTACGSDAANPTPVPSSAAVKKARSSYSNSYACRRDGVDLEICAKAFRTGDSKPSDLIRDPDVAAKRYDSLEQCLQSGRVLDIACSAGF